MKPILFETPNYLGKKDIVKVLIPVKTEKGYMISFQEFNSLRWRIVPGPGYYNRYGKKLDKVVLYDLGDCYAPMREQDAKRLISYYKKNPEIAVGELKYIYE